MKSRIILFEINLVIASTGVQYEVKVENNLCLYIQIEEF